MASTSPREGGGGRRASASTLLREEDGGSRALVPTSTRERWQLEGLGVDLGERGRRQLEGFGVNLGERGRQAAQGPWQIAKKSQQSTIIAAGTRNGESYSPSLALMRWRRMLASASASARKVTEEEGSA